MFLKGVVGMWYDKLKKMKEESGLTTDEICLRSGVPLGTLNKIFANQTKNPKLETIKSIVHALGFTLDDLNDAGIKSADYPDRVTNDELKSYGVEWVQLAKNSAASGLTPKDIQEIIDIINRKKL
jgi:transcriptional regulator with XRE-family HTH domain